MSQFWAAVAFLFVGLSGCTRSPPEPSPASSTDGQTLPIGKASAKSAPATTPSSAAPSASGARCITPTPAEAPAIPPVASVADCPKDPDGIPKSQSGEVTFPDAPGSPKVDVELAITEHEITRGLMYRRSMAPEHGMLFHLDERREHTFWMHNTCMPLDMLFIDDDGTVVGIVEAATPLTDSSRTAGCPSVYVLEVNAGWCRRHGVKAGQKVGIPANAR